MLNNLAVHIAQDQNNDIQEALGQNYNLPDDIDEDELLGELDALEDDLANESTEKSGPHAVPSYLQVPKVQMKRLVFAHWSKCT